MAYELAVAETDAPIAHVRPARRSRMLYDRRLRRQGLSESLRLLFGVGNVSRRGGSHL